TWGCSLKKEYKIILLSQGKVRDLALCDIQALAAIKAFYTVVRLSLDSSIERPLTSNNAV
ncbi:hypothetical protein NRL14_20090, partial [Pseudoalteromonas sp. 20-92]|uniref:hypothetical protein n=1 Tax=Pseudoalteromonas sp. 20-92 TaxID=2969394 RepID=UPI0027B492CC